MIKLISWKQGQQLTLKDEKFQDETDVFRFGSKSVVKNQKSETNKSDESEPSIKSGKISSELNKETDSTNNNDKIKPEFAEIRCESIKNQSVLSYNVTYLWMFKVW